MDRVGDNYDDHRRSASSTSVDRQHPNGRKCPYAASLHITDSGPTSNPGMCWRDVMEVLVLGLNDNTDLIISSLALITIQAKSNGLCGRCPRLRLQAAV